MFKALFAAAIALAAVPAAAQDTARLDWKTFHSKAIEGNLEGNSAERGAYVVTPPGYDEHPDKRYPVVYFLHGYWATPQMYQESMKFEEAVTEAAAAGNEVIMVIPDGFSKLRGGFYSNSPTVGNYEGFIGEDLVEWVDAHYRTIAKREARGLSGHSMGGYGTMRVGMKYPEVFSSLFVMNACCLAPMPIDLATAQRIAAMTPDEIATAEFPALAAVSTLATWAPDPTNPPNYIDTGLQTDGSLDPMVNARLTANSILAMLPQYLPALRSMEAIGLDLADKDFMHGDNMRLKTELARFGIALEFEEYEGDHGNRIPQRIRGELLPFFGEHLDRE